MRLKFIVIVVFMIVYGLFFFMNTQIKNERVQFALNKQIETLETHYNLTKDYFLSDARSMSNNLLNNKKIKNILRKAQSATKAQKDVLRKELYEVLKHMFERMQIRGITQLHFVLTNNISFFRMHKPKKHGDDLSNIRYSFKYANEYKRTFEGFEQGKSSHAFRYTFPYFDNDNNHLGAIDISLASNTIQEKLLKLNKIHSHFLVNKKIYEKKVWETKHLMSKYIQSIEDENYMFSLTQQHSKKRLEDSLKNIITPLKDQIKSNISLKKAFSLFVLLNNTSKVITFLPIKDIKDKKVVAYIVSYTDNTNIYNVCENYKYSNIIIFIGMVFLFYFIYKNLNYRDELKKEVKTKTKDLQKVSNDLKELNENLEQKIIIEVEKNKHIQEQLFKSEKLASMGEMIGNIAHQWRQPLSLISTASTGIVVQKEYGILNDDKLVETCNSINRNAQYLSKTIDDFRNFIKGERIKTIFNLKDNINSFLHLVESSIKKHQINIILDLQVDIKIDGYENELTQCLINIFNNAKDILEKNEIDKKADSTLCNEDKLLFISTLANDKNVIIKIKDNGGGIPKDIINKIFEPYFTTKHQSQGTGLGLHMAYNLIVDGMNGTIKVTNQTYTYKDKEYIGAEFIISLPI